MPNRDRMSMTLLGVWKSLMASRYVLPALTPWWGPDEIQTCVVNVKGYSLTNTDINPFYSLK